MRAFLLATRVYKVANQYNIEQTKVHNIITSYISYCKDQLLKGYRIDFLGLASVIPNTNLSKYNMTLAYECSMLADDLGLPTHTVYVVVNEYIESLIADVLAGNNVEVRSIFSMHPIRVDGVVSKVHASISPLLKLRLAEYDSQVTEVRVHTSKTLKDRLEENNDKENS